MGIFFKDVDCADCRKKAGLFSRTQLADGNYLCSDCTSRIPTYMWDSFRHNYELEDYLELKEYFQYSDDVLRPVFRETHKYYNVHIDTKNRLMYIGSVIDARTVFFHLRNVDEFSLTFSAEEFKEGVLNDKVTGKILLGIKMGTPGFYYEKIIDRKAKAKAKKKLFGSKVQYDNPKGMDDFMLYFNTARYADLEAEYERIIGDDDENDCVGIPTELQQAISLFMIDDLSAITLSELKAQRNRLIKTFHPDTASDTNAKYAQKINAAYEVLKEYIE